MGVVLFIAVFTVLAIALGLYRLTDPGCIVFARLRGKRIIAVRGVSSAIRGQQWRAVLEHSDWPGGLVAYRYPGTKIGMLSLNADGTGDYCGNIEWRQIYPHPDGEAGGGNG